MSPSKKREIPFLLFSTVSNFKEAKTIANVLIKKRLAACVNIAPHLKSYFRWQRKLDQANELLLMIKTEKRHLKKIEMLIRQLHSYETPEIIGWPITWGSKSYLDWLVKSIS